MAKGGARKGAGRKPGVPNKSTREAEIAASGITPLDYMLKVLRADESSSDDKKWAAAQAAPYVHPKLAAVEHSGELTLNHETALDELE